jgi:predicted RNA-binding Zn-ribbon protein involved in translation (DUF1610 family)
MRLVGIRPTNPEERFLLYKCPTCGIKLIEVKNSYN